MKARYSERIRAKFPVSITVGSHVSEGRILDLTVPGCLIESPVFVKKGDYVQLRMTLPGLKSPVSVALAAVRWTKGSHFGVEFIKMDEKEQRQLNQVMAQYLPNRAVKQEGKRHQFSAPGGHNWHLDTYSLAEGHTERGLRKRFDSGQPPLGSASIVRVNRSSH
jgi:hypothetical protein